MTVQGAWHERPPRSIADGACADHCRLRQGGSPVQSGSAAVAAMPDTATMTVQERVKAGRALWEEKCRTVAGEKIYRTVENCCKGYCVLKVRPAPAEGMERSKLAGAAFARESQTDEY
ncbi:MAG: hypothetical protein IPG34_10995 [Rhodocyclaceae bacterium]|nr:hypothetical protein [Rhodocyclaceae bacterium]